MTFLFASHSVWWFFIRWGWEKESLKIFSAFWQEKKEKRDCVVVDAGERRAEWKKENWKAARGKPRFSANFDSANVDADAKFLLIQGFRTESFIDGIAKLLRRIIFSYLDCRDEVNVHYIFHYTLYFSHYTSQTLY